METRKCIVNKILCSEVLLGHKAGQQINLWAERSCEQWSCDFKARNKGLRNFRMFFSFSEHPGGFILFFGGPGCVGCIRDMEMYRNYLLFGSNLLLPFLEVRRHVGVGFSNQDWENLVWVTLFSPFDITSYLVTLNKLFF